MRKSQKRMPAGLLVLSLVIGLCMPPFEGGMAVGSGQTTKAAEHTLSNPKVENGVTTWDCVWFGNYWQNDTNGDGKADQNDQKESIKWRVLSVDGDDAFLLADQNLDCKKYNETDIDVTWETCTLRSWLNGYGSGSNALGKDYSSDNFLDAAFTQIEQAAIYTTSNINDDNPLHGTEGGNNTQDKVYLLSIAEAGNVSYGFYWKINRTISETGGSNTREADNTAFAGEQGAWTLTSDYDGFSMYPFNGMWWLRSPGAYSNHAYVVGFTGEGLGSSVAETICTVRPALHLNLSDGFYACAGTVSSNGRITKNSISSGNSYSNSKVSISKASNPKPQTLQVSWKRITAATKYQVQYSTAQSFGSSKGKTTNKNKIVIKGLKKKKTYYVRVRAQFKDGSWSKWSVVKRVKIKK